MRPDLPGGGDGGPDKPGGDRDGEGAARTRQSRGGERAEAPQGEAARHILRQVIHLADERDRRAEADRRQHVARDRRTAFGRARRAMPRRRTPSRSTPSAGPIDPAGECLASWRPRRRAPPPRTAERRQWRRNAPRPPARDRAQARRGSPPPPRAPPCPPRPSGRDPRAGACDRMFRSCDGLRGASGADQVRTGHAIRKVPAASCQGFGRARPRQRRGGDPGQECERTDRTQAWRHAISTPDAHRGAAAGANANVLNHCKTMVSALGLEPRTP
jgi:hypothetical protein